MPGTSPGMTTNYAQSIFHQRNIRRVRPLHADDVIAGIDVMHFAGDATRQVREQIQRAVANLLDGDGAAHRRVVFVPLQNIAEVAVAGRGERLHRARRDRTDPGVLLAEIAGVLAYALLL